MKPQKSAIAAFSAEDIGRMQPVDPVTNGATDSSQEPNPALTKLVQAMGGLDTRPPFSPVVLAGMVRLMEFLLLCAAGAITQVVGSEGGTGVRLMSSVATPLLAMIASAGWQPLRVNTLAAFRAPLWAGPRLIGVWALVCLLAAVACSIIEPGAILTATRIVEWFGLASVVLIVERLILAKVVGSMTRQGRLERRTVIVGGGQSGEELLDVLSQQVDPDLRIYGVFDDRNDTRSPNIVAGYPKLGTVSDLVVFARKTRIDLIIFTLPITAEERLLQMLRKLWVLPIDIRLAAHRTGLRFRPRSYSYVGDVPVLDVFDKPIADWDIVIKSIFDRVVGALALVAFSPVLLLTALAVKLDSKGPVFFKQKRHGFNNESVEVYKFRSLYADQLDFNAVKSVTKDDPRVTRVGRFIRKTSLDELPQLFNVVFKGNLSLVGPRPHALHAQLANKGYNDVVDGYFARHKVKPGITGWAQVNGWRGETDTPIKIQKRVEHDLAYIENWSIFFDIYILLITPLALTRTENAY